MFLYELYRECYDPIQEAIAIQLGNPDFNDYPSIETILIAAIDEKYSRLKVRHQMIIALKRQGYTNKEVASKIGCTERNVYYLLKKISCFSEIG